MLDESEVPDGPLPSINECYMTCSTTGKQVRSPADFKREFNVSLGFVPILGPVEHKEPLSATSHIALINSWKT